MAKAPSVKKLKEAARQIRLDVLNMSYKAHIGHVGPCFSIADTLAALYFHVLKVDPKEPLWEDRDRFILSKGHAAAALYSALARRGFMPISELDTFCKNGTKLSGHPEMHQVPGVEVTTGSLGHGLPLGLGMAKAAKHLKKSWRVFCLLSDGECNEGTVWEAALAGRQFELDNVTVIIDRNRFQALGRTEDVMKLEPLAKKWQAFGWNALEIDGHDVLKLATVLSRPPAKKGKPTVIIAKTVMGKGVSFMEDRLAWHYLDPKEDHYQKALKELAA